jgi:O-acetyl-ADP-ribose deacetylase (regulator of RNase III)
VSDRELLVGATRVAIARGDITAQQVDAIVNAANSSLLGGGGVDGAIHRKGGPAILDACRAIVARIGRCATGEAVATTAGRLPARIVVHTVGPVWQGGARHEDRDLARAWRRSLEVAIENGARSVAFPAISTGAFGFPADRAARVALGTVGDFLRANPDALDLVRVVLFSEADHATWSAAAGALLPHGE